MTNGEWHSATLEWDGRRTKVEKALDAVFRHIPRGANLVLDCGNTSSNVALIRSIYQRANAAGWAAVRLEGLTIREEDQPLLAEMESYLLQGSMRRANPSSPIKNEPPTIQSGRCPVVGWAEISAGTF